MKERIACKTCNLRDKCNDLNPIVGVTPVDKGRPRMDICVIQLKEADQTLKEIREEIEKELLTDEQVRDAVIKVSPEAKTFMQDMEFIEDFRSVAQAQLDKVLKALES